MIDPYTPQSARESIEAYIGHEVDQETAFLLGSLALGGVSRVEEIKSKLYPNYEFLNPEEVLGSYESVNLQGVTRQAVSLRQQVDPLYPDPFLKVSIMPLWLRPHVSTYATLRDRGAGQHHNRSLITPGRVLTEKSADNLVDNNLKRLSFIDSMTPSEPEVDNPIPLDKIVDIEGVARILNFAVKTVRMYTGPNGYKFRRDFPLPIRELKGTRLWLERDIVAYATRNAD